MGQRLILPVVLAVALFGAIVYIVRLRSEVGTLRPPSAHQASSSSPTSPSPTSTVPRTITAEQHTAMLDVLRSETGSVHKVWFQVETNRPEPAGFQKALADVFREAGWEIETAGSGGMTFKPGVSVLVADDEWPSYASTAYDALQKAGIDVKAARGYRSYYEEQKREKPNWQGPTLAPDQTYVVIVGPSPAS
jgi:hypothetical protein